MSKRPHKNMDIWKVSIRFIEQIYAFRLTLLSLLTTSAFRLTLLSLLTTSAFRLTSLHAISITQVAVLDSGGYERSSFFNTETITLKIDCYNETNLPETDRIWFKFFIHSPTGDRVFSQEGNSATGSAGIVGSELHNIPISFYSTPGEYTFTGEVVTGADGSGTAVATGSKKFTLTSANISLTYPPNGSQNLPATPLIFRWVASGATKYKVYVADNAAFYRTLWSGETYISEITYPENPTDPLAKLSSGRVYWWKVEGLDAQDRVVATTPIPFSFTIKDITRTSRDLSVENIKVIIGKHAGAEEDDVDADDDDTGAPTDRDTLKVKVYIRNQGNEAMTNINLDVAVAGGPAIPTITIKHINPGRVKVKKIDCGYLPEGETVTVSATINVMDDNPNNNSLTKVYRIPEQRGKVLGGVTSKTDKKAIEGATVNYSGPVTGSVKTNNGGQYQIEKLPYGTYVLYAVHPDYKDSEDIRVVINKQNAQANIDFELEVREREVVSRAAEERRRVMSIDDVWSAVKDLIKDRTEVLEKLEDYYICSYEIDGDADVSDVLDKIKSGKAEIVEVVVE
ncbi:MAG: carboxypeptidase-like regulatory domain-containing protein [Elusimicrobiota bacterium]